MLCSKYLNHSSLWLLSDVQHHFMALPVYYFILKNSQSHVFCFISVILYKSLHWFCLKALYKLIRNSYENETSSSLFELINFTVVANCTIHLPAGSSPGEQRSFSYTLHLCAGSLK